LFDEFPERLRDSASVLSLIDLVSYFGFSLFGLLFVPGLGDRASKSNARTVKL
jgi:hypothetical protein